MNVRALWMVLVIVAVVALIWVVTVVAQEGAAKMADSVAAEGSMMAKNDSTKAMETGPVTIPEPSDKAMRYYRSGNVLWAVQNLWYWIVPLILLFTGLSSWFEKIGYRFGKKWYFAFAIYILLFTLTEFILNFPLSYYDEFIRQHAYGLSNQSFGAWFGDSIKSMLIGLVLSLFFLWIPLRLFKKFPRTWWLRFSVGSVPFIVLLLIITPIWIQPMFNDFGPMQDKQLEQRILALADRAGIEGSRVFEVNKSEDTNSVNAYVTGFGGTKRIVLWDTIIEKMDDDEILFVMGHEMGHYVLGHMYWMIAMAVVLILIGLYTVHLTAGWVLRKWGDSFGFHQLSDIAAIPLILLLFSLTLFVLTPFNNGFIRSLETQCDQFGLELTRNNHAAATAFIKLQQTNLANPRPGWFYKLWRADHPPIGERIDLMNHYKPWEEGGKLKYGKYIKSESGGDE